MTFLAPTAGLVAGAIAVPVFLALYMLKLRRRPVRVGSTLLWRRATKDLQVNTPLRRLRASLLLALQLLAVGSLVLAIARPAAEMPGAVGDRTIFVIDRSASMSALDGVVDGARVSRLEQAKRLARDRVRAAARSTGGGGVMVVAAAAEPVVLTGLDASAADARNAIAGITPTDQPLSVERLGDLLAALSSGVEVEGESGRALRVVVLSDGDVRGERMRTLPGSVSVEFVRAGPAEGSAVANAGIIAMNARRDYDDLELVRVFARVANADAQARRTTIELVVDGEVVDARPLEIAPGSAGDEAGGEQGVSLEFRRAEGGVAVLRLGGSDVLASDDAAGAVIQPARRPLVLLVHPAGEEPDVLLAGILSDLPLAGFEIVDDARARNMMRSGDPSPAGRRFGAFDVIVYDRVSVDGVPTAASLSFGAGPALAGLSIGPSDGRVWGFTSWRRDDPLLRHIGLDAVEGAGVRALVVALDGEPAGAGDAPVLRTLALGSPLDDPRAPERGLIVAGEVAGIRHVVVGVEPQRSNWGADLSFPVFMLNAVEWLTGGATQGAGGGAGGGAGSGVLVGGDGGAGVVRTVDPIAVRAAPGVERVTARGPLTRSVTVSGGGSSAAADGVSGRVAELGVLELAGVYTIDGAAGGDVASPRVAVSVLDAGETLARPGPGVRLVAGAGEGAGEVEQTSMVELWPWFVLVALVLTSLEWALYAWRMRG